MSTVAMGQPQYESNNKGCLQNNLVILLIIIGIVIVCISTCSCTSTKHIYYPPMEVNMLPTSMFTDKPMDTLYIKSHNKEHVYYIYNCKYDKRLVVEYYRTAPWDQWQSSITYKKCKPKAIYYGLTYRRINSIKKEKSRIRGY